MHSLEWPRLKENRKGHVEIMASFPDRSIWRNKPPGEPYHSVYNALFEKAGAVKLYEGRVPNFSRPTFFSCCYLGESSIFVMLDRERVFLLDRNDYGNRELESISIDELKNACLLPHATFRSADDYPRWCDASAQSNTSPDDAKSLVTLKS